MELCLLYTGEGNVNNALSHALGKTVHTDHRESGAPYIRGDDHCMSLSHKNKRVVIALSDRPVGVDIELLCEKEQYFRIADTYFGEKIARGDYEGFFRGWTRREAYGKLLGVGLTPAVMRMDMSADVLHTEAGDVHFVEKRTDDGYIITAACYYTDGELKIIGEQDNE